MSESTCAECGRELPPRPRPGGTPRRYCSNACRQKAFRERHPGSQPRTGKPKRSGSCASCGGRTLKGADTCSACRNPRATGVRPCKTCGAVIDRGLYPHRIYCSTECKMGARLYKARVKRREQPTLKACRACGDLFDPWPNTPHKIYCSRSCAASVPKPSEMARRERLKVERARSTPIVKCPTCGERFQGHRTYCRKQCRPSWARHGALSAFRYKVVKAGDRTITLERLMERDEGRCWICGLDVDPAPHSVRAVNPKGGSIDHVVPISRGGLHEWDNVRLAHFDCNAQRGAAA